MPKSRMFSFVDRTSNPIGARCPFGCVYCWSQGRNGLIERLRMSKYSREVKLYCGELKKKFRENEFIFLCSMLDWLAPNIPDKFIDAVLLMIKHNPKSQFLTLTKNPWRINTFARMIPSNMVFGTTIETDLTFYDLSSKYQHYSRISNAPDPRRRLTNLFTLSKRFDFPFFISIEPILAFSPNFGRLIAKMKSALWRVAIGYDNYGHELPEPKLVDTQNLIYYLNSQGIRVTKKTLRKAWYEL